MFAVVDVGSKPADGGEVVVLRVSLEFGEVDNALRPERAVADVIDGVEGIPVVAVTVEGGGVALPGNSGSFEAVAQRHGVNAREDGASRAGRAGGLHGAALVGVAAPVGVFRMSGIGWVPGDVIAIGGDRIEMVRETVAVQSGEGHVGERESLRVGPVIWNVGLQ